MVDWTGPDWTTLLGGHLNWTGLYICILFNVLLLI